MAWIGAAAVPVEEAFADHPYFFHYHPWSYYNFQAVLNYFNTLRVQRGARRIAIAYEDGPFGSAGIDDTVQAFRRAGFEVVMVERFRSGSGSFGPLVSRARAARPDIFYWIGYDADALPLATEIRQQNLQVGLVYGTPPSWPIGFERNPLAQGMAGLSLWLPGSPNRESQRFVQAYRAKFGNVIDEYFAPLAYVNLRTLAAAINRASSTDKDRVAAELARTNVETPFGRLTFTPSNRTRYQGFKTGSWLHFQYQNGARVGVFPLNFAQRPVLWGTPRR